MTLPEDIAAEVRRAEATYDKLSSEWAQATAHYSTSGGDYPFTIEHEMDAALKRYHRLLRLAQQNGVVVYKPGEKEL